MKILSREGVSLRVSKIFFKDVVQSVLLFGADTWVFKPHMGRVLGGFQYQVARQLTGQLPRWRSDGRWEYSFEKAKREDVWFEPMETYIR